VNSIVADTPRPNRIQRQTWSKTTVNKFVIKSQLLHFSIYKGTYTTAKSFDVDPKVAGFDCRDSTNPNACWVGLAKNLVVYLNSLKSRNVNTNRPFSYTSPIIDIDQLAPYSALSSRMLVANFFPTTGTMFEGHLMSYPYGDQSADSACTVGNIIKSGGSTSVSGFDNAGNLTLKQTIWDAGSNDCQVIWDAGLQNVNYLGRSVSTSVSSSGVYTKKAISDATVDFGISTYESDATLQASYKSDIVSILTTGKSSYWAQRADVNSAKYMKNGTTQTPYVVTDLNSWTLGDVYHAQPVVVGRPNLYYRDMDVANLNTGNMTFSDGYENFKNSNIGRMKVVYAAANDGMLHAFKAGVYNAGTGLYAGGNGTELWSYVPNLVLKELYRLTNWGQKYYSWEYAGSKSLLKTNKLLYRTYSTDPVTSPVYTDWLNRPLLVDGSPTVADVWVDYINPTAFPVVKDCPVGAAYGSCEWQTVLVGGLGMGGRGYYVLNVGNAGSFDVIKEIGYIAGDADMKYMGFTTSDAIIGKIKKKVTVSGATVIKETWVAMFGGGYHPNSDPGSADYAAGALDGRAFYVYEFDGTGGKVNFTLLSKFVFSGTCDSSCKASSKTDETACMCYAMAAPAKAVDYNNDGYIEGVYIGDLGGQVWRFDFRNPIESGVAMNGKRLFYDDTNANVRFWTAPSVVSNSFGQYYVLIGSGDRMNMLSTTPVGHFYALNDVFNSSGGNPVPMTLYSDADLSKPTSIGAAPYKPKGWVRELAAGQKSLFPAVVAGNDVFFTTFKPPTTPATSFYTRAELGEGKLYVADFMTGGKPAINQDWWAGVLMSKDVLTAPKIVSRGIDNVHPQGQTNLLITSTSGEVFQIKELTTGSGQGYLKPTTKVIYWREQ